MGFLAFGATIGQQNSKKLPGLFQRYQEAIAAGIVPGFGSLQKSSANADKLDSDGRPDNKADADARASDDDASPSVADVSASDADASASDADVSASDADA